MEWTSTRHVDPNVLSYWSIVSLSRALRFKEEACNLQGVSPVFSAVATYYSLFHLGIFLMYCMPQKVHSDDKEVKKEEKRILHKINAALKNGTNDPRKAVSHEDVCKYLRKRQSDSLPKEVVISLEKAKKLREFVNYGPDLIHTPDGFRVLNRAHDPSECSELIEQLDTLFCMAVTWLCENAAEEDRLLIPISIETGGRFFTSNPDGEAYYSQWSPPEVLRKAELLRVHLFKIAERLIT